jgi:hypothetical protein
MRWYFGYPILAAGLAFGLHTYLPKDPSLTRDDRAARFAEAVAAQPEATVVEFAALDGTQPSRLAAFLPGSAHFAAAVEDVEDVRSHTSVLDYLARTLTNGLVSSDTIAFRSARPAPVHQPVTASEWKSAVLLDVREPAGRREVSPRASLTRDIQQELQRVGCYTGEIDGVWGTGSRRAILLFMDRVNALLPTQEPDVFMLSLVRAESGEVCGTACPSGQSLTGNGRCLPSTLMAQGGRHPQTMPDRVAANTAALEPDRSFETSVAWEPAVIPPSTRPALEGRMSIGGPRPDVLATEVPADLSQTAVLEPTSATDPSIPVTREVIVRESSFDERATTVRTPKTAARERSANRPAQRRAGNYRHVQRLFEHPLGRM